MNVDGLYAVRCNTGIVVWVPEQFHVEVVL